MTLPRRQFLQLVGGAAALPGVSRIARAQAYPTRPVIMIVPYAAGGPVDVFGRILAEGMRRSLGQPVVVENVAGADGSIGVGRAAHARPDGYTINVGIMSTMATPAGIDRSARRTASEQSPPLRKKPPLQCRADPKFVDGLPDGRLLIRRLDTAKQRGRRPLYVIDAPGVLLARGRRRRRLLRGGRPLHRGIMARAAPGDSDPIFWDEISQID
jgi:hypothetical protein